MHVLITRDFLIDIQIRVITTNNIIFTENSIYR